MKTTARCTAYLVLLLCVVWGIQPLGAQSNSPAHGEISQIVDEVLNALVPPEKSVSRVPVAHRKVYFDHVRTMTAFGYGAAPLSLRTVVNAGTKALHDDCNQFGSGPCARLGWGVYAWIEPVSASQSEAVVRAHLVWPDRGRTAFEPGVVPSGRALLVGYIADIHLRRGSDGKWEFVKQGRTLVG